MATKVKFYDSHPGFAGAAICFPNLLKEVADSLDGVEGTLEDAMTLFREAGDTLVSQKLFGKVEVKTIEQLYTPGKNGTPNPLGPPLTDPFITVILYEGDGNEKKYPTHQFKAICYDKGAKLEKV